MNLSYLTDIKSNTAPRLPRLLAAALALTLAGCVGPPTLQNSVIGYDETTARLDQELLLLNVARLDVGLPIHFTKTSSIAATFNWSATIGATDAVGSSSSLFNLGASASENPTFSIIPVSGDEFTKRVLKPLNEDVFNLAIFEGERVDQSLRLLSNGIEVQRPDGTFLRVIENDPSKPEEFTEFRRLAMHLQMLRNKQQLFVRRLVFEETLFDNFTGVPRSQDVKDGFDKGFRWRQKSDGNFQLNRFYAGRLIVTNYDPLTLSDRKRYELNEKIKRNPKSFVYLDLSPDHPGGELSIQGAIRLRSLLQIIGFIAAGINLAPEFDVPPDPRTGQIDTNPAATLKINVTDSAPARNVPSTSYTGKYYSIADTAWDRRSFAMLAYFFQTAVGSVEGVGIPITISK